MWPAFEMPCYARLLRMRPANMPAPRDRLIVALDVPSIPAAASLVERLGHAASFYKIGYQLAFAGGIALAETLVGAGKQVFLDLNLHGIGNTVEKGV